MLSIIRSWMSGGAVSGYQVFSYILASLTVVFLCTPLHECAHAITAIKLGDPTPKYMGRNTLNPMAHIDWIGALLILLFGFGYAKPVQVNMRNFKNPKSGMAITALAGPVSNVIAAFVFFVIYKFIFPGNGTFISNFAIMFCSYAVSINISLAVFNIIPIPPLDGSKLLAAVLPDRKYYWLMQNERFFILAIFALIFLGVLDIPLAFLQNAIISLFRLLTFWI